MVSDWTRVWTHLLQILHDLICEVYAPNSHHTASQRVRFVSKTRLRLDDWWRELPQGLKCHPNGSYQISPPSYVMVVQ
jgi:hypothetical protein